MLRFRRVPAPEGSETGTIWHQLTTHLVDGCLSFQVLSCTRLNKFRVFPTGSGQDGVFRLVPGDASAVEATAGDKRGGHGQNFYIQEQPGTFVRICVQLLYGAPRRHTIQQDGVGITYVCRGTAVWYVVEQDKRLLQGEFASLSEPAKEEEQKVSKHRELPALKSFISGLMDDKVKLVIVDEFFKRKFKDVLIQAREMGERTFPTRWRIRDLHDDRKIVLLVDTECTRALGYCLYIKSQYGKQATYIKEFTISAMHRGKGLGIALLRWVLAKVGAEGSAAVHLHSFNTAVRFYMKLGFEDAYFPPVTGCTSMALRLPVRDGSH